MPKRVGSRKVHNKKLLMPVQRPNPGMDEQAAWIINAEHGAAKDLDASTEAAIKKLGGFPRSDLFG